jgi:hypothetical protein
MASSQELEREKEELHYSIIEYLEKGGVFGDCKEFRNFM